MPIRDYQQHEHEQHQPDHDWRTITISFYRRGQPYCWICWRSAGRCGWCPGSVMQTSMVLLGILAVKDLNGQLSAAFDTEHSAVCMLATIMIPVSFISRKSAHAYH